MSASRSDPRELAEALTSEADFLDQWGSVGMTVLMRQAAEVLAGARVEWRGVYPDGSLSSLYDRRRFVEELPTVTEIEFRFVTRWEEVNDGS